VWDSKDLGVDKLIHEERDDCDFYVAEIGQSVYLIAVYRGKNAIYARISTPYVGEWDCRWVMYSPAGLFAFAKSEEELKSAVKSKLMKLHEIVTGKLRPYYK
jgi:hypothetical protein